MANRRGFTLVELLAVLALMAILLGVAVLNLKSPRTQADVDQVVARIESLDRLARLEAKRRGGAKLLLSTDAREFVVMKSGANEDVLSSYQFPTTLSVVAFTGGTSSTNSRTTILYDALGQTETFGLRIQRPGKGNLWVTVVGMTGQQHVSEDEEVFHAIWQAAQGKTRTHTH